MTGIQISNQMNYQKTALAKFTFNILNVKYYYFEIKQNIKGGP